MPKTKKTKKPKKGDEGINPPPDHETPAAETPVVPQVPQETPRPKKAVPSVDIEAIRTEVAERSNGIPSKQAIILKEVLARDGITVEQYRAAVFRRK